MATEVLTNFYHEYQKKVDQIWDLRDKRVDGWFMLDSVWPTVALVVTYVYIVKIWGPNFMKDKKPYNINTFLVYYNACQVILSAYIFIQVSELKLITSYIFRKIIHIFEFLQLMRAGWWRDYSYRCQPVDYSNSPKALLVSFWSVLPTLAISFSSRNTFSNKNEQIGSMVILGI